MGAAATGARRQQTPPPLAARRNMVWCCCNTPPSTAPGRALRRRAGGPPQPPPFGPWLRSGHLPCAVPRGCWPARCRQADRCCHAIHALVSVFAAHPQPSRPYPPSPHAVPDAVPDPAPPTHAARGFPGLDGVDDELVRPGVGGRVERALKRSTPQPVEAGGGKRGGEDGGGVRRRSPH